MHTRLRRPALLVALFATIAFAQPTTAPAVLKASDQDAIKAAKGNEAVVEGVVTSVRWSGSGKVCEIKFEGAPDDGFTAVVFEKNRKAFDEAFSGDFSKALTGATIKLRGRLREYNGKSDRLKGRVELTIEKASQLTVVTPPATQPS